MRFQPGDPVLVTRPSREPVPATIRKHAPYRHNHTVTDGYYVNYRVKEQWECAGGWVMASCLRSAEGGAV